MMKDIDFGKYKSAWKEEKRFNDEILPEADIKKYLNRKSKSLTALLRSGLIIDMILKIILGSSFVFLVWLYSNNSKILALCLVSIILIGYLLFLQIKTYKQIPGQKEYSDSLRHFLESKIEFYRKKYSIAVYINALSNPFIFLSGMLFYFQIKYSGIRPLQVDDYLVFSLFCIAGFVLSAFVQVRQYNFQIKQLEDCLNELDENGLKALTLVKQKSQNRKVIIIFIIALILGLLAFGYIMTL
jgi:hypothetical protein